MPSVVSRREPRITSVCSLLRPHLWPYSDGNVCLIARRSVAFLPPWIRPVWKRYAACSRPGRAGSSGTRGGWGRSVGSARTLLGGLRVLSAPDRLHDSVRCPRVLISPRHSDACKRSVLLATRDASAERGFALAR